MSLSDIKNKLYSQETDKNLSKHNVNEFDIRMGGMKVAPPKEQPSDAWEEKKAGLDVNQKKAIKLGAIILGGIALFIFAVFGIYKYTQSAFSEGRVTVKIEGATDSPSGQSLAYEISYSNDNRATLKNAILRVSYPESFKPGENGNFKSESQTSGVFSVGDIAGNSGGKVILTGNAYSPRGTLMYIKGELVYTPSNFSSQFVARNQLGVNINSSPVNLEVMAPQELANGDALDYEISYINNGQEDFENIKIRAEYPDGFSFSRANPVVSEGNNVWYIGHLAAGQSGKIVVSGKLEGNRDEVKNITAYIGVTDQGQFVGYNEEKTSTKLVFPPITISQLVNGVTSLNAKAGDTLRFTINYKNDGSVGLHDVIITDKLDSPVLDYTKLELMQKGGFDQNNKTIIWKGVDSPTLKFLGPGESGEVDFSVKVKEIIPVNNANDKNFVISNSVKMDSPDIPTPIQANKIIAGNNLDIKLDSKIFAEVKGFYYDPVIPNSGPVPPQVGQATTYTIHWKAYNVSNDVSNAQMTASLPTGVTMTEKVSPDDGKLTYNARNNTIVWDIGNFSAGSGIINSPKEMIFQVQITPALNQFDDKVDLIGPTTFSATDLFTGSNLSATADKKDTGLTEDPQLVGKEKVVK